MVADNGMQKKKQKGIVKQTCKWQSAIFLYTEAALLPIANSTMINKDKKFFFSLNAKEELINSSMTR